MNTHDTPAALVAAVLDLPAALAAIFDLFIPALIALGVIAMIWFARNDQELRRRRK